MPILRIPFDTMAGNRVASETRRAFGWAPATPPAEPPLAGARCARPDIDPEIFFPVHDEVGRLNAAQRRAVAEAKAVCFTCAVRTECLRLALARPVRHGIVAGTTPRERIALVAAAAEKGGRP